MELFGQKEALKSILIFPPTVDFTWIVLTVTGSNLNSDITPCPVQGKNCLLSV